MDVTRALYFGELGFEIDQLFDLRLLRGRDKNVRPLTDRRNDARRVLLKSGEDRFFGKIIAELARRDRLRAIRRQIAETPAAFFDRNAVILQQKIKNCSSDFDFLSAAQIC